MAQTRSLDANDRLVLKSYAGSPWRHVLPFLWGFLFLWGIAVLVSYAIWPFLAPFFGVAHPDEYVTHAVVAVSIAVALFVAGSFAKFMRRSLASARDPNGLPAQARRDLSGNTALIEIFSVSAAVEIAEVEDEGTGFFLALDDGRVLCVLGQDLYDFAHDATGDEAEGIADERAKFPQTRIAYTYAPNSKLRLDVKGTGEPLRPRSIAQRRGKNSSMPEDGAFYDGPLEAVLKRLGYKELPLSPDPPQRTAQ